MLHTVSVGALIRDLRTTHGWSQGHLAGLLCDASGRSSMTREEVSRWERGKVIPGPYWIEHLSVVLAVNRNVLLEETRISRVDRRAFLSLAALTAAHGKVAAELVASVAAGDPGPLATVQTTHGTDLVIASMVDRRTSVRLHRWMTDGSDAVLRVNTAGILAKVPGQDPARNVASILAVDDATRRLYTTAVLTRACLLDWTAAGKLAANPLATTPRKAAFIAHRLADEALNPRDAGARWCSAAMLRDLSPLLGRGAHRCT